MINAQQARELTNRKNCRNCNRYACIDCIYNYIKYIASDGRSYIKIYRTYLTADVTLEEVKEFLIEDRYKVSREGFDSHLRVSW